MSQRLQLVRSVDDANIRLMIKAALRGELDITFTRASDQLFFSFVINGKEATQYQMDILTQARPATVIEKTKDAEALFTLRFGRFEQIK